jgi:hypothetical protein
VCYCEYDENCLCYRCSVGHVDFILMKITWYRRFGPKIHKDMLRWIFFNWLGFTSHQHCKGLKETFQLCWRRKTSGAARALFQVRTGTRVEPQTSRKIAGELPHMKESKVPGGIRTQNGNGSYTNKRKSGYFFILIYLLQHLQQQLLIKHLLSTFLTLHFVYYNIHFTRILIYNFKVFMCKTLQV